MSLYVIWKSNIYYFIFFRHPIPDYYSISVEIARDRITTASETICDSNNPHKMPCPEGYLDGDTYLHRSTNEACQKMVSRGRKKKGLCYHKVER